MKHYVDINTLLPLISIHNNNKIITKKCNTQPENNPQMILIGKGVCKCSYTSRTDSKRSLISKTIK